ncbi:unnamed protein product [marine sediment metagenome]|uniref:Uncharacterized protein n=1 Tax=marine sediment metagenome TaxID=412755 RepID=X1LBA9_9ZZZZ
MDLPTEIKEAENLLVQFEKAIPDLTKDDIHNYFLAIWNIWIYRSRYDPNHDSEHSLYAQRLRINYTRRLLETACLIPVLPEDCWFNIRFSLHLIRNDLEIIFKERTDLISGYEFIKSQYPDKIFYEDLDDFIAWTRKD